MIPSPHKHHRITKEQLQRAIQRESKRFEEHYAWIEKHMPDRFFEEMEDTHILMIVYSLMGFGLSDYFSHIHLKDKAFVLSLDSPDVDLRILERYRDQGIKNYRSFISNAPPPFRGIKAHLRVARLVFNYPQEKLILPKEQEEEVIKELTARNKEISDEMALQLIALLPPSFVKAMTKERLVLALDALFRARSRDECQYEVRYNEDWKDKKESPSLQVVFAWKNVPQCDFLYQLAKVIHRHGLVITRVNATHIDSYGQQNILLFSVGIHGSKGGAAWEETNVSDFLQELVTFKYFPDMPLIEHTFVDQSLLTGNQGNFIKAMASFIHQSLVHIDLNMYAPEHIQEDLCRHKELTTKLVEAFEAKFHPKTANLETYARIKEELTVLIEHLDTGNPLYDMRRKNILKTGLLMIEFTLKTNYYLDNKSAFSFRLNPFYLDHLPFDRKEKFPEIPYAIFFIKGLHFIGFHIRFRDLSRGGLRTVFPEKAEQALIEKNNVFSECYNLAYTQNKKNKDIPEGGAKAVIFVEPNEKKEAEEKIYIRELKGQGCTPEETEEKLIRFQKAQRLESLYQSQRCYIDSFLTLINCEPDGKLRAANIVDYWQKPEYIYLGPDENMHNSMIEWIANRSKECGYKSGGAFITSKPGVGVNHKEYGVTSLGVNECMEEVLKFLNIDPYTQSFSVKMTGGPDGDVAGNEMYNLYRFYPKTAKLLATIDVSGTIFDPEGLDLETMAQLFKEAKPLRYYPPEKLHEGGFLLDTQTKRKQTAFAHQTLCWRKKEGRLVEEWLSGNEMNALLRHNVHQVKADIFIPGGGRPRTLNETNIKDFLDEGGVPTAKAIIEGANLYLTPWARRSLEKLGVLIVKDSSANKGGVTSSSFEVLFSLALSEQEFLQEKPQIVEEILEIIKKHCREEVQLMLATHKKTGALLTDISEWISERINLYKDHLSQYLQAVTLSSDPHNPLIKCLLNYCPPLLREKYQARVLQDVPDVHKKAIIACYLASRVVYYRGLDWSPSLVDVLPLIMEDPLIVNP